MHVDRTFPKDIGASPGKGAEFLTFARSMTEAAQAAKNMRLALERLFPCGALWAPALGAGPDIRVERTDAAKGFIYFRKPVPGLSEPPLFYMPISEFLTQYRKKAEAADGEA
jgi:hypothetical protein